MSRTSVLALPLLILFSVSIVLSQSSTPKPAPPQGSAKIENEIRETIRQRLAALRREDAKAYISFFAPDAVVTNDAGALIKPEEIAREWSQDSHAGIAYHGSDALDLEVHSYGDVAVATFRLELDEDWSGQKLLGASRYTDVYAHRGGRWLLVAHQETPIPNLRRVPVRVDPSLFDLYAGEYQLTPNYIVKVKREGDKLMDLWPGDTDYAENVPVDDNTFVARGESGEVIYVKGSEGKITHFILRTSGGDLIARKIK
jgi:ketosteroid isomerase-like protein